MDSAGDEKAPKIRKIKPPPIPSKINISNLSNNLIIIM